ncbi:single-stranded DNA-binding protein (plasmid) [Limosilactobacillus reuteri]|uniref:Single-stranded DNA-binding protein n=1 Tax=Limosilactobacillus reuteri TaxID=1598 RepID=A0A517D8C6_LIMRT|nr:single-stranded DNA-binding protein [Limosilactobacillus reuteri]QDR73608.1 single-stranded DNA-binding protein [Limosilactobacillus reuteri]
MENSFNVVGIVSNDPELKESKNHNQYLQIKLLNRQGNYENHFSIIYFGNKAKELANKLYQDDLIYANVQINTRYFQEQKAYSFIGKDAYPIDVEDNVEDRQVSDAYDHTNPRETNKREQREKSKYNVSDEDLEKASKTTFDTNRVKDANHYTNSKQQVYNNSQDRPNKLSNDNLNGVEFPEIPDDIDEF